MRSSKIKTIEVGAMAAIVPQSSIVCNSTIICRIKMYIIVYILSREFHSIYITISTIASCHSISRISSHSDSVVSSTVSNIEYRVFSVFHSQSPPDQLSVCSLFHLELDNVSYQPEFSIEITEIFLIINQSNYDRSQLIHLSSSGRQSIHRHQFPYHNKSMYI